MSKMSIPNYRPYLGSVIFNALIHIWINSASHKQCKPYLIVVICGKAKRIRTNEHPVMKRRQYTRFLLNFSSQATYAFVPSKVKASKTEKMFAHWQTKIKQNSNFLFLSVHDSIPSKAPSICLPIHLPTGSSYSRLYYMDHFRTRMLKIIAPSQYATLGV